MAEEVAGSGEAALAAMTAEEEALYKEFTKEVSEAQRAGEVERILSCFKLNPYEHLNLPFEATEDDIKKQYRKLSLLVHPDKNPHPRAKDAFAALGKAMEWLGDADRKKSLWGSINHARELVRKERKKEVKADAALAAQIRLMAANGVLPDYEKTEDFAARWKQKAREVLTEIEWRRRKMTLRIKDEEERIKEDEKESKSIRNAEKKAAKQWEESRDKRVGSWRDFQTNAKKHKATGELKPPKLKEEDADKSYVQRRVGTAPGAVMGGKPGAKNKFKRGFN